MLNKAFKNKNGITLIALIITIIVLLILAGVTIAAISSNESAPNKAVEARQKNDQGAEFDAIKLATVSSIADGDYTLHVNEETLRKGLTGLIKGDVNTVIGDNATEWQVEGYKTGRLYKITNMGTVEVLTAVTSINLTKNGTAVTTAEVEEGSTNSEITVTTVPAQGTNVESLQVTSSDETKATAVIENGVLKITGVAKAEGIVITVSSLANNVSKTVTVKVKEAPLPIGEYVDYAVSYKDMYSDYVFSSTNGWRILDPGTPDGNGGYTGTKIVSTGVPGLLNYFSGTTGTWWGDTGNANVKVTYGMKYNFKTIPFVANTSPSANNIGYKAITNSAPVKDVTNTANGSVFITTKAVINDDTTTTGDAQIESVHALTLEELNKARSLGATSTTSTATTDGATGLFYLRNLANENSAYLYTSNASYPYWFASPGTNGTGDVRHVGTSGYIGSDNYSTYGVRPVVSLNSSIYKDGNIWKIR